MVSLADANIVTVAVGGATVWGNGASWLGGVGAAASMTNLPESQIKSSDSSFAPSKLPQCMAERQTLADGTFAHVVTARGFSPDYTADSTTGVTTNGSVVWLQSTLLLQ